MNKQIGMCCSKVKRGSIGLVWLSLVATLTFADSEGSMISIEANANAHASLYANDIRQITRHVMKSEKEGSIATFSQEIQRTIKQDESITEHLKKVSQVLVFLSFSMPEKSLHGWLLQCKQSGATPVIRGLIHNSFRDTMLTIQRLSQTTGVGMQLDPILFKTFDIQVVPAVVVIKDTPACPANMNCKPVDYDSLYGDVSLDYALEKMRGDDSAEDSTLEGMILRLRGEPA